MIHIIEDEPDGFEVWTDTEIRKFDGRCLASGRTLKSALARAFKASLSDLKHIVRLQNKEAHRLQAKTFPKQRRD